MLLLVCVSSGVCMCACLCVRVCTFVRVHIFLCDQVGVKPELLQAIDDDIQFTQQLMGEASVFCLPGQVSSIMSC